MALTSFLPGTECVAELGPRGADFEGIAIFASGSVARRSFASLPDEVVRRVHVGDWFRVEREDTVAFRAAEAEFGGSKCGGFEATSAVD